MSVGPSSYRPAVESNANSQAPRKRLESVPAFLSGNLFFSIALFVPARLAEMRSLIPKASFIEERGLLN
jgi:hypothetical protein